MYRLHGRALNRQVWMVSLFSAQGAYLSIQASSLLDDLHQENEEVMVCLDKSDKMTQT